MHFRRMRPETTKRVNSPDKEMWTAVIERAYFDAMGSNRIEKRAACAWFFSKSTRPLSYKWAQQELSLQSHFVKKMFKELCMGCGRVL